MSETLIPGSIENALGQHIFSQQKEKTFIDKLISKDAVTATRDLIRKDNLKRDELSALLHMCSSEELKLLNYNDYDRHILSMFFVWIRDFVAILMGLYDYEIKYKAEEGMRLTKEDEELFQNARQLGEHNVKFLVDLYFNLARSTVSLGATGFMEILKNRFEISYPKPNETQTIERRPLAIFKR